MFYVFDYQLFKFDSNVANSRLFMYTVQYLDQTVKQTLHV